MSADTIEWRGVTIPIDDGEELIERVSGGIEGIVVQNGLYIVGELHFRADGDEDSYGWLYNVERGGYTHGYLSDLRDELEAATTDENIEAIEAAAEEAGFYTYEAVETPEKVADHVYALVVQNDIGNWRTCTNVKSGDVSALSEPLDGVRYISASTEDGLPDEHQSVRDALDEDTPALIFYY